MELPHSIYQQLLSFQRQEFTEFQIYSYLAQTIKDPTNSQVFAQIAEYELRHYQNWQRYTRQQVKFNPYTIWKYKLITRLFGFTFGIKLMENGEGKAQVNYAALKQAVPEVESWISDEQQHEETLIALLDEEHLKYVGSVVLGLNYALVELTGALAGLTLALQNTKLIALTGLITGISAALSMATSEYLSTRTEKTTKQPLRAAIYTGITYIVTVALLIFPYLLFKNYYIDLAVTLGLAIAIIATFNYYVSVATSVSFRKRFVEMAVLSLSVAGISFIIGYFIRKVLGVDV